jgi:hypothetical protein
MSTAEWLESLEQYRYKERTEEETKKLLDQMKLDRLARQATL